MNIDFKTMCPKVFISFCKKNFKNTTVKYEENLLLQKKDNKNRISNNNKIKSETCEQARADQYLPSLEDHVVSE